MSIIGAWRQRQRFSAALEPQEWDLIFSDYTIPGFSGTQALSIVRGRGYEVPFIFNSGMIGVDIAMGNIKRLIPAIERELRDARQRCERK